MTTQSDHLDEKLREYVSKSDLEVAISRSHEEIERKQRDIKIINGFLGGIVATTLLMRRVR